MKRSLLFGTALLLACLTARADETMTKITFRAEAPDIAADSFGAKPKTLYLYGNDKGRVEEAPDPSMHLTGLMIANGKDGWMINLWDKSGRHFIDPGPTYDFHAPIVPRPKQHAAAPTDKFELGHEIEFMTNQKVAPKKITRDGKSLDFYECTLEGYTLQVYADPTTSIPIESVVIKDGKSAMRLIYDDYQPKMPANPALFQPPAGIAITEAKSN